MVSVREIRKKVKCPRCGFEFEVVIGRFLGIVFKRKGLTWEIEENKP